MPQKPWYDDVVWQTPEGDVVSCIEKLKVMSENFREIEQTLQDAFEDALLMGCREDQVRAALMRLVGEIKNPYAGR